MDDFQQQIGSILSNPEMMSKIMTMAQSFRQPSQEPQREEPPVPVSNPLPMDPAMLQKIMGLAQQTGIDRNQQALLKALSPYLSRDRIQKLEKAMRAARLAGFAATALNRSGPLHSPGR